MKKLIHICLVVPLLVFTGSTATYAGFRTKSKEVTTISTMSTEAPAADHHKTFAERKLPRLLSAAKQMAFPHAPEKHKSGWQGIASLVCGVAGLFTAYGWLILGICAIVFGAIGLNKSKHTNTGMALAGLILGSVEILLFLLLVAIFAALLL